MLPPLPRLSALAPALLLAACGPASAPEASPSTTWTAEGADAGIAGAHLTQGVQDPAGSVPLVEGRAALLRVFLGSRHAGLPAPAVRARLVSTSTGATVRPFVASSPLTVIPTGTFPGVRAGTWNAWVPGDQIVPDRHLVIEIDEVSGVAPGRTVTSVRVPAVGSLDVRAVAPLAVTIVPVIQAGLIPDVERFRTAESWVSLAAALYPVPEIDVEVAATPLTSSVVLDGSSESWSALLSELEDLRAAEGTARHWVGAVRTTSPGTAGRGFIGGSALLASDDPEHYQRIVAHELGHNLGLRHAPCGTESGLDAAWPLEPAYDGARTGVAGWDVRRDAVLDPGSTFDVMSYCGGPADTWISDYTYLKALDALLPQAPVSAAISLPPDEVPGARAAGRASPPPRVAR